LQASVQQCFADEEAFVLEGEVLDDAEQVAGIDTVGKGLGVALALEGGDAGEDGVYWIASDGGAVVAGGRLSWLLSSSAHWRRVHEDSNRRYWAAGGEIA